MRLYSFIKLTFNRHVFLKKYNDSCEIKKTYLLDNLLISLFLLI